MFDERASARGWRLPAWLVVICFVLLAGVCVIPFLLAFRQEPVPGPQPTSEVTVTCTAPGTATC